MFWAGCLLLAVFAALSVMIYFSPDPSFQDEEEMKRLRAVLDAKEAPKKTETAKAYERDWPGWRGPKRDGRSPLTGLNLDWDERTPPELWRISVGDGLGSMAVVDNRVFTQFQNGSQEVVGCFDAKTGTELWRHSYDSRFEDRFGTGPRSTPTVDGDLVFTVGPTGILHCLDAVRGTMKWRRDMREDFGVGVPTWAFSFSPLVVGDLVFINPGGDDANALAALDRSTGKVRWKGFDVGGGYSSPIFADIQGQKQVIFFVAYGLVGVVPETGKELWRYPWTTRYDANIATPLVFDDYVFISSGYNAGAVLVRIEKADDGSLAPRRVYQHRKMKSHFSSSVYHDGFIYGFSDKILICIAADDPEGRAKWTQRERGHLILVEDHLIVFGETGQLAVVQATPTAYVEKGRMDIFKERPLIWSAPALADGLLFVRDRKQMVCLDLK